MSTDEHSTPEPRLGASPARPPASFLDGTAARYAAPVLRDLAASLREAEAALPAMLDATPAGRYRIVSQVGRGGMALVYLAEDLRHGRPVAIKVIRPEIARDIGAARFLHEIAFLGRLQHPHIPPLLDSGEVDGLPFYVMPHVEGESLRARLEREPRLPVEEALRIARDVADALEHAHAHGVVHRDVKPDNVLLQGRHALVADFGIARAITRAANDTITSTGVTPGTPAYMSPEQATGRTELDGRSDVFSLGAVLHRMLCGEAPFRGATPQAVIAQVISMPAPSITERREGVPPSVERIVARALAKEPAERFQTAGEMRESIEAALAELARPVTPPRDEREQDAEPRQRSAWRRRWQVVTAVALVLVAMAGLAIAREWELGPFAPSPPSGPIPWILVTDFDGPSSEPTLTTAVRDLVASSLDESGIAAAVPRDRVRQGLRLAGKPDSTLVDETIGRELAIRASIVSVLTGRIDRVGDRYSILLRVVDADSGTTLLTERAIAADANQVIPALDDASRRLRAGLGERRSAIRSTRPLTEVATPSLAAFQRFAESGELARHRGTQPSIAPLREALVIDPAFASAWFSLGIRFNTMHLYDSAAAAFAMARRHSARLSDRERLLLEAWEARLRRDFPTALAIYDRALQRYPNSLVAQTGRGNVLGRLGRGDEGLDAFRRALAVDPFGPTDLALWNLSGTLMSLGRWREAADVVRQLRPPRHDSKRLCLAVGTGEWPTADSLGRKLAGNPAAAARYRRDGARALASALAARGAIQAADSVLMRADEATRDEWENPFEVSHPERDRLLLGFATGTSRGPGKSAALEVALRSDVLEGIWGPAARDPASVRRVLVEVRTWTSLRQAALGIAPKVLAAMLAARAGRHREVVNLLAVEGAATHPGEGVVPMWMHARWLVAQSYERLDMPDSAAWYYRRVLDPAEAVRNEEILSRGLVYSFAHQRLVVLYARMGRVDDARRHWLILRATFTRPDPELVPLVEAARAALAKAERGRG